MILSSEMRGLTTSQSNILVDDDGVACISEYGLEVVLRKEASSKSIPGNIRWMAPEILTTKERRVPSGDGGKAADVYSLAMVMFEVCIPRVHPSVYLDILPLAQVSAGTTPFPDGSDEEVVGMVTAGLRPERPSDNPSQELSDELWEQIVVCWNHDPNERPTALKVLRALGEAKNREDMGDSDEETAVRDLDSVTEDTELGTFSGQLSRTEI